MENIKANILKEMFEKQLILLASYQKIEGLPEYPVDINTKAGQKLLKDFGSRIIEELSEAYIDLYMANDTAGMNDKVGAQQYQLQYNLEVGDALAFILEFLIFAGYGGWEDIEKIVERYLQDNSEYNGFFRGGKPFNGLMLIAGAVNFKAGQRATNRPRADLIPLRTTMEILERPITTGGRNISSDALELHAQLLWEFTVALNISLHYLKNKDWSQTEKKVNIMQFEQALVNTLIQFAIYLDYAGFTEISIGTIYRLTFDKNEKRIKYGY